MPRHTVLLRLVIISADPPGENKHSQGLHAPSRGRGREPRLLEYVKLAPGEEVPFRHRRGHGLQNGHARVIALEHVHVDRPYRRYEHLAKKETSFSGHVQHAQLV
jgi:hypothetical protein